ncbi:MAG: sugar ABC transporter substrate-binding protein [Actinobacteria bacterium]|nr:sugar ABC transporter substrate-binding protein [Actinomycetota bacterium]
MKRKALFAIFCIALMGIAVVGCGGGGSSTTSSTAGESSSGSPSSSQTTASSSSSGSTAAIVGKAKAFVAKVSGPTNGNPEGFKPVTVPPGKTVGIVECGVGIVGCTEAAEGAAQAAKMIGWQSFTIEAKEFSPPALAAALEEAVQRKPDVIIAPGGSDASRPQAMTKAKEAGIPVISAFAGNEVQPPVEDPSTGNVDANYTEQGEADAYFAIANSGGDVKVAIQEDQTSAAIVARYKGFEKVLEADPEGEVVTTGVATTIADANAERTLVSGWLAQYPKGDLNYVMTGSDAEATGAIQAINTAGRSDVKVLSYDCQLESLAEIIKGGAQIVCANTPLVNMAWEAMDLAIRALDGEKVETLLVPTSLITKENAPPEGQFPETYDPEAFFKTIWKVTG